MGGMDLEEAPCTPAQGLCIEKEASYLEAAIFLAKRNDAEDSRWQAAQDSRWIKCCGWVWQRGMLLRRSDLTREMAMRWAGATTSSQFQRFLGRKVRAKMIASNIWIPRATYAPYLLQFLCPHLIRAFGPNLDLVLTSERVVAVLDHLKQHRSPLRPCHVMFLLKPGPKGEVGTHFIGSTLR